MALRAFRTESPQTSDELHVDFESRESASSRQVSTCILPLSRQVINHLMNLLYLLEHEGSP